MNTTCVVCGEGLPIGSRSDRLTCSDVCRMRRARFKKKIASLTTTALDAIYTVAGAAYGEQFSVMASIELEYLLKYVRGVHADLAMGQPPRQWWQDDK